MTHVTCRLTAKNRDQLRNPTLGNRVWAIFTFFIVRYFENRAREHVSEAETGKDFNGAGQKSSEQRKKLPVIFYCYDPYSLYFK